MCARVCERVKSVRCRIDMVDIETSKCAQHTTPATTHLRFRRTTRSASACATSFILACQRVGGVSCPVVEWASSRIRVSGAAYRRGGALCCVQGNVGVRFIRSFASPTSHPSQRPRSFSSRSPPCTRRHHVHALDKHTHDTRQTHTHDTRHTSDEHTRRLHRHESGARAKTGRRRCRGTAPTRSLPRAIAERPWWRSCGSEWIRAHSDCCNTAVEPHGTPRDCPTISDAH